MSKLVLIDGYSLLNRAYYAMPKLTDKEGRHTGAVFGFVNILQKILEDETPSHIVVAMDEKAPTFRHKMFEEYKGTRKPMDEELRSQLPIFKELLSVMGIKTVSLPGYEADDIIGSIAKSTARADVQAVIVSGDRDLLQLVDENIKMRLTRTIKGKSVSHLFTSEEVREEFKVSPKGIIDLKALMGDASDNIPGVKGIGEKTADKLLEEYRDLDGIYAHIDEIKPVRVQNLLKNDKEMAYLSRDLATIHCEVPIKVDLSELVCPDYYQNPKVYEMFRSLGFRKQLERFRLQKESVLSNTPLQTEFTRLLTTDELSGALFELQDAIAFYPLIRNEKLSVLVFGNEKQSFVADCDVFSEEDLIEVLDMAIRSIATVAVLDMKKIVRLILDLGLAHKVFDEDEVYQKEGILDLSLIAYIIDSNKGSEIAQAHGVLSMLLQASVTAGSELFGKKKEEELLATDQEDYYGYLAALQKLMLKAGSLGMQRLSEEGLNSLYRDVELPLALVLADMEHIGIQTDRQVLHELSENFEKEIVRLQTQIYEDAKEEFNINSPKQLGEILFEKLKLPSDKKTKTGYSTSVDVLDKLKASYPIVQRVLDYRHYVKLKTTYADALPGCIREDGRIHGTFQQTVASTGRLSSTDPNLQNIPTREADGRLLRKAFVAREGHILLDADYSQIELRILAHLSQDERLISAYNKGEDIHRMTAAAVFDLEPKEVTDAHRRNAKAVNFGIIYGISAFGLSNDIDISMKEAKEFIKNYFDTFPGIKGFLDGLVKEAKDKGYASTLLQRRRYIPELKASNFMTRSFGERIAMNAPIQGTAADIIKIAMIRVHRRLRRERLSSKLILQVHDELMIETALEEKEAVRRILQEEMMRAMELTVPLSVEIQSGKSWYEAK